MSKRKINLICAKRGRDANLRLALHNLNLSDDLDKFDVVVYIGEDRESNINQLDYAVYDRLQIKHFYVPTLSGVGESFCKGHLLNQVLQQMRSDYDWLSIMDVDLVYRKDFFTRVDKVLKGRGNRAVHNKGYYAGSKEDHDEIVQNNYDHDYLRRNFGGAFFNMPSQICITRSFHEHICKLMTIRTVYDTASLGYDFIGWGSEDCWVENLVKYYPGMKITFFIGMWCHIWHEPQPYSKEGRARNSQIVTELKELYLSRLYGGKFVLWRQFWRNLAFQCTSRVYHL